MPVFEYCCQVCGDEFELLVRGRETESACPACGAKDLKKKFSIFGFQSGSARSVSAAGASCGSCASHNCSGCHH